MTNAQLFFAIGVPMLFNGLVLTLVTMTLNARISDLGSQVTSLERRFEQRMANFEQRMATKEELRRVEEVLDARLKHIEEELEKRRI